MTEAPWPITVLLPLPTPPPHPDRISVSSDCDYFSTRPTTPKEPLHTCNVSESPDYSFPLSPKSAPCLLPRTTFENIEVEEPYENQSDVTPPLPVIGWLFDSLKDTLASASISPNSSFGVDLSFSKSAELTFASPPPNTLQAKVNRHINQSLSSLSKSEQLLTLAISKHVKTELSNKQDAGIENDHPKFLADKSTPDQYQEELEFIICSKTITWHRQDTSRCIAGRSKLLTERCKKRIKNPISTETLTRLLHQVTEAKEPEALANTIDTFLESIMCRGPFSHTQRARKHLQVLKNDHSHALSTPNKISSSGDLFSWLQVWVHLIIYRSPDVEAGVQSFKDIARATPLQVLSPPLSQTTMTSTPTIKIPVLLNKELATAFLCPANSPARLASTENETQPLQQPIPRPVYKHYAPSSELKLSTSALIRKRLLRPLTKRELEPGYLYAFWYSGNFGLVKIGYSTNPAERFKKWQKQCRHQIQQCLDKELLAWTGMELPHAERLEKLVHAELRDYRMQELQCVCRVKHREWFETSTQHVKMVIGKWINFGRRIGTYEMRNGGKLTSLTDQQIDELCTPILQPPGFVTGSEVNEKRSASRRRSSGSRNSTSGLRRKSRRLQGLPPK